MSRHLARYLELNYKDLNIEKFTFLTSRHFEDELAQSVILETENEIFKIYLDFSYDKIPKVTFEELRKYEKIYGIPNLYLYAVTDREFIDLDLYNVYSNRYKNIPNDRIYDLIIWHIKKFENVFEREKFDLLINLDIPGFEGLILNKVAEKKKCIHFYVKDSRIVNRISIVEDEMVMPIRLNSIFKDLLNRELTKNEENLIDTLLLDYRGKKIKRISPEQKKTRIWNFMKFNSLFNFFKILNKSKPKTEVSLFKLIKIALIIRLRVIILKLFGKSIFDIYEPNDKYFYFPMFLQPELVCDYINPFIQNQFELIYNISKTLPAGYKLYVKEHPASFGINPIGLYKRLKKIPNVKLLHHFDDSYQLIRNCVGVFTVYGTSGWEAFLLGKPVITFGNVFYNLAEKGVFLVKNLFELPFVLQKVIEDFKLDENYIKKFLLAKYNFTYPGKMYPFYSLDEVLSEENIKNITSAIVSEYKRLKHYKINE
jgi:hypothetical protein